MESKVKSVICLFAALCISVFAGCNLQQKNISKNVSESSVNSSVSQNIIESSMIESKDTLDTQSQQEQVQQESTQAVNNSEEQSIQNDNNNVNYLSTERLEQTEIYSFLEEIDAITDITLDGKFYFRANDGSLQPVPFVLLKSGDKHCRTLEQYKAIDNEGFNVIDQLKGYFELMQTVSKEDMIEVFTISEQDAVHQGITKIQSQTAQNAVSIEFFDGKDVKQSVTFTVSPITDDEVRTFDISGYTKVL